MPCDPRQADEIAAATLRWIEENVPGGRGAAWTAPLTSTDNGMSTFIWFGQLDGGELPDSFRAPLALRVFSNVGEDITLERERAILDFVAASGYPVPVPLAAVPSGSANPVGLPWMVLPHVPGRPLLAVLAQAPWSAPTQLRELAALQARLHALPVAGAPLPVTGELVDRWFVKRGAEIDGVANARSSAVFDALRRRADIVRGEQPVVCHGDFHPLNILSDNPDGTWHHVVIDWTDAVVGDRHFDVARTLGLFRVAAIAAGSTAERIGLQVAAPFLARVYRRAYERAHPLEQDRLTYWTAAHFLRGWSQIMQLHEGDSAGPADAAELPVSLADALLERAERAVSELPAR